MGRYPCNKSCCYLPFLSGLKFLLVERKVIKMDPFEMSLFAIPVAIVIGFFLVKLIEKIKSKPYEQVDTEETHVAAGSGKA